MTIGPTAPQALRRPALALLLALFLLSGLFTGAAGASVSAAAPGAELIVNGGFESGATGWNPASATGNTLVTTFFPLNGQRSADLAGGNNNDDSISQLITLPPGRTAWVQFWWALSTDEPAAQFDTLTVSVLSSGGALLRTLATFDNTTLAPYTWDRATYSLSAFSGQTIRLQFTGKTDGVSPTEFFIDDVSVQTGLPTFLPLIRR